MMVDEDLVDAFLALESHHEHRDEPRLGPGDGLRVEAFHGHPLREKVELHERGPAR
jgi:hypothetical protein